MPRTRIIRNVAAGLVLVIFSAVWAAMLWTGRGLGTFLTLVGAAVILGAGYHLWDDAMSEGTDTAQELQGGGDDADEGGNDG